MPPIVQVVVFPRDQIDQAKKAASILNENGITAATCGCIGGIKVGVGSSEEAKKAAALLQEKGVYPVIEQTSNGNIAVKWITTMKQMLSGYLVNEIKNDPNIDTSDMKVETNFNSDMVTNDVYVAKSQTTNIKFSFIDNKISNKVKLQKIENYRIKELDKMNEYFDMIEQDKMEVVTEVKNNFTELDDNKYDNEFDSIEKWWLNQTKMLRSEIQRQFIDFQEEFELISINLLYNSQHAMKFMKHENCEQSVLMFHGTSNKVLNSIFQNGFVLNKGSSAGKLYGNGHYVTPQMLHAIRYMQKCKDWRKYENNKLKAYTLIAAFVNPGKIKHISSTKYKARDISFGYDTHHCKVMDGMNGRSLGLPVVNGYIGDIMDEYAVSDSTRILPRFHITLRRVKKLFVWRDKNIANKFNGGVLEELKSPKYPGSIYGVMDTATAINLIKRKMHKNEVYVITNGADDGHGFVDKVRKELRLKTNILVFCRAVEWHSKWASLYQNVEVKCGKAHIVNFVKDKYQT